MARCKSLLGAVSLGSLLVSNALAAANVLSNLPIPIPAHPLYVEDAPQRAVPYITNAFSHLQGVTLGAGSFRFSATKNSTNNAFSVVLSASKGTHSSGFNTPPHWHERHYETFYSTKGGLQFWAANTSRVLSPGDAAIVPNNVSHTFAITEPDTFFIGVQAPGGFEDFFFVLGKPIPPTTLHAPYNGNFPPAPPQIPTGAEIQALQAVDFYLDSQFVPNMALVNGSAPASGWHVEPNELPGNFTPYYMARAWGPFFLNAQYGFYQVVSPLVTQAESGSRPFTLATISISKPPVANKGIYSFSTKATFKLAAASFLFVEEGHLWLKIGKNPSALLTAYDQAFIPPNTSFSYYGLTPFTKVLYASGGSEGSLDETLIQGGQSYSNPIFPITWQSHS